MPAGLEGRPHDNSANGQGAGLSQSITPAAPRKRNLARVLLYRVSIVIAALAVSAIAWLGYCEYNNSRAVPPPSEAELREHFERAASWMFTHAPGIATENNPMLWVFIDEAGKLTGNAQLLEMATAYQQHYTNGTLSQFFFDPRDSEKVAGQQIHLPYYWADYQRLFVYGSTCNDSVREDPEVLALLTPSGCEPHLMWLRSPWCHTHQLMGLRFVQKNHCEPGEETARTINAVQDSILAELRWDFRVEDAYLQKVMTLLESGRRKDIKPIWIKRILEAQRADGGWDGADIIAHLPGNRALVWEGGRLYPWPQTQPQTNLHATAQGLYLLALLLKRD
jgi:hypothetical protein